MGPGRAGKIPSCTENCVPAIVQRRNKGEEPNWERICDKPAGGEVVKGAPLLQDRQECTKIRDRKGARDGHGHDKSKIMRGERGKSAKWNTKEIRRQGDAVDRGLMSEKKQKVNFPKEVGIDWVERLAEENQVVHSQELETKWIHSKRLGL